MRSLVCAVLVALTVGCSSGSDDTATPPPATASAAAAVASGSPGPTPRCTPNGPFTPAQTEGPYFKEGSPSKRDFSEDAEGGRRLVLTGFVVSTSCRPLAGAKLDFWQADAQGNYDNTGYRMRGHQFTDAQGRYRLVTVVPGRYPGRTPHLHITVTPPTGASLTTQLYMPDEASNAGDNIFDPNLVMDVDGEDATFTFILVTE